MVTADMDADYLRITVGNYLAEGLAEVSCVRPSDPIQYLAQWLLKHEANRKLGSRQDLCVAMVTDSIAPTILTVTSPVLAMPPQTHPGTHGSISEVESDTEHRAEPGVESAMLALDPVYTEREGAGEGQEETAESRIEEKMEDEEVEEEEVEEDGKGEETPIEQEAS